MTSINTMAKTAAPKTATTRKQTSKSNGAYRTISEVANSLNLPTHVLRFWETKFTQISPMKRSGGRRYYKPEDVEIIARIQNLLHEKGFTIKGVQQLLSSEKRGLKSNDNIANNADSILPTLEKARLELQKAKRSLQESRQ